MRKARERQPARKTQPQRGHLSSRLVVAAVLLGMPLALFWRPLLLGYSVIPTDVPYFADGAFAPYRPSGLSEPTSMVTAGDEVFEFYAWRGLTAGEMHRGRVALWNPYSGCGTPLLANDQSAIFHPLNLTVNATLSPLRATLWFTVLSLVIASWGTYLFVRRLGGGRPGALLAAIVFTYGGYMLAWQGRPQVGTAMWLPWLLLSTHRLVARPSIIAFASTAALVGIQFLSGHIRTSMHMLVFWIVYTAALTVHTRRAPQASARPPRSITGAAALMIAALALGLALGAIQLLPTAEYIAQSDVPGAYRPVVSVPLRTIIRRGLSGDWTTIRGPVAVRDDILCVLSPGFFGSHARGDYRRNDTNEVEQCAYLGIIPLIILVLYWRTEDWHERFFRWAALIGLGAAVYAPVANILNWLPVLATYQGARWRLVFCFGCSVVVGLRLRRIGLGTSSAGFRLRPIHAALGALIAIEIALAVLGLRGIDAFRARTGMGALDLSGRVVLIAPAVIACIAVLMLSSVRAKRAIPVLLAVLAIADVGVYSSSFRTRTPFVWDRHPTLEIARAQADREVGRVTGDRYCLQPNTSTAFGLYDTRSFDVLAVQRYGTLTRAAFPDTPRPSMFGEVDPGSGLTDLMGVRYLFASDRSPFRGQLVPPHWILETARPPLRFYRNTRPLPRAFVVSRSNDQPKEAELQRLLQPDFDPRTEVVISARLPVGGKDKLSSASYDRHTTGEIEVHAKGPGVLVVTEAIYPGWIAKSDDAPVALFPADYAFMGVSLPEGEHSVVLQYRPYAYLIGAFISLIACCLLCAFLIARAVVGSAGSGSAGFSLRRGW